MKQKIEPAKEGGEISTTLLIVLTIVVAIIALTLMVGGWIWGSYNTFVTAEQDVNNQWSNIKTEYQRRADLLLNMVEITQTYSEFEKDTLVKVTQARSGDFGSSQQEEAETMGELDRLFSRFLLTYEAYPELKSIEQFNKLSEEFQRTENRVQIARTDYNSLVRSYNILVGRFPKNMLANWWGYEPIEYFESQEGLESGLRIDMK